MTPLTAANLVLSLHLAFLVFAVFGGALVCWRQRIVWLHLPALAWGVWIETSHGICPLTALENRLLDAAGAAAYSGGFIEQYAMPLIYPPGLQPNHQLCLAAALLGFNLFWYFLAWRRHCRPALHDRNTP